MANLVAPWFPAELMTRTQLTPSPHPLVFLASHAIYQNQGYRRRYTKNQLPFHAFDMNLWNNCSSRAGVIWSLSLIAAVLLPLQAWTILLYGFLCAEGHEYVFYKHDPYYPRRVARSLFVSFLMARFLAKIVGILSIIVRVLMGHSVQAMQVHQSPSLFSVR